MSCCLLGKYQGLLNKSKLKQASLDNQIAPGDQIGRPDFHILVMSKIWSPIWSPGAIWSPIRSPERLVVDLVVVDAVTLSTVCYFKRFGVNTCPLEVMPFSVKQDTDGLFDTHFIARVVEEIHLLHIDS